MLSVAEASIVNFRGEYIFLCKEREVIVLTERVQFKVKCLWNLPLSNWQS